MVARSANDLAREEARNMDDEIAEVSLLLPSWQAAALQERAQLEGLTAAQFLRRLIRLHCLGQRTSLEIPEIDCV
jgi:hypothetical protein